MSLSGEFYRGTERVIAVVLAGTVGLVALGGVAGCDVLGAGKRTCTPISPDSWAPPPKELDIAKAARALNVVEEDARAARLGTATCDGDPVTLTDARGLAATVRAPGVGENCIVTDVVTGRGVEPLGESSNLWLLCIPDAPTT